MFKITIIHSTLLFYHPQKTGTHGG